MVFGKKKKTPEKEKEGVVKDIVADVKPAISNDDKKKKEAPKDKIDKELEELNSIGKTELDKLEGLDTSQDAGKGTNKNLSKKLYRYWVYIYKNNKLINNFGVNEEPYAGVKLLVRRQEVKGQSKVIFRELYPEPSFDLNWVKNNVKTIRDELNKQKQIEKKLLNNMFNNTPQEYNYDLSDIRLKIQEKEILLQSIRYGVTTEYFRTFRDDGIPALEYDMENSSLVLRKYVKEKNIYTEASESKKIRSEHSRKQIDSSLNKRKDRDYLKAAYFFMAILMLAIGAYLLSEMMTYNSDRAFAETQEKFEQINQQSLKNYDTLMKKVEGYFERDVTFQDTLIQNNNEILNSCVVSSPLGIAQR